MELEQITNLVAILQIVTGLCMVFGAIVLFFRQKENKDRVKSLVMLQSVAGVCMAFVGIGTLAGLVEHRITSLQLCLLVFIPALAYLIRNVRTVGKE